MPSFALRATEGLLCASKTKKPPEVRAASILQIKKLFDSESGLFDYFSQQAAPDILIAMCWHGSYAISDRMAIVMMAAFCI